MQETDGMIGIGGRSWHFLSAEIERNSWEGEWRSDGKLRLHDGTGKGVEGTEVENPEVLALVPLPSPAQRRSREILLARVMLVQLTSCLRAITRAGDASGDAMTRYKSDWRDSAP